MSSPAAVSSLRATSTPRSIHVYWKEPLSNGSRILSYNIDVGDSAKPLLSVDANTLDFNVTDLMPETAYKSVFLLSSAMLWWFHFISTCDSCTSRYGWERVLAMGILSVRLSVTTRYRFKAMWDRDSGSLPYDSLESLVSYEVIWCHCMRRFSSNKGIKEGYPLRNRYFTTIGSSSVKTVVDRHILAAYRNKHCWRAFQWYQHRWFWTTLNPENRGFSEFF